jgi:hypothetical protein
MAHYPLPDGSELREWDVGNWAVAVACYKGQSAYLADYLCKLWPDGRIEFKVWRDRGWEAGDTSLPLYSVMLTHLLAHM